MVKRTHLMAAGLTLMALAPAWPGAAVAEERSAGADTALVRLGSGETATNAFVVWPAGDKPAPAVVIAHEWWGLNAQIRRVARRLAREGYVAIIPDLYRGKVAGDPEYAHELVRALDEKRALADLDMAMKWLNAQPRTKDARIGVIGFCMGGGLAQKAALGSDNLSAAVMFYGGPVTDPERIATLKAPLQAHFGEADRGITLERVKEFEAALKKAEKDARVYIYPGAGHAFMNETRDSFNPDASRQGWARTLSFFQMHLKGSK